MYSSTSPASANGPMGPRVLCSVHGWCLHTDTECTAQNPALLTPERRAEIIKRMAANGGPDDRWSRVICWNCGELGHTKGLCPEPLNEAAVAASTRAFEARKQRRGNAFPSSLGSMSSSGLSDIHGGHQGNYSPSGSSSSSGSRMSTGTVQPAPSGLSFSQSIVPPRPSGPCAELSGWSRQLTRTELGQLRTAVHGVSAIQEIDKGARLLFSSVPLLEVAVPIL